jgi:hypothetical protein
MSVGRSAVTAFLLLVLANSPASADVVATSRTSATGMGMVADGESVTYLKGLKMRTDTRVRGETLSTIIDLESGTFISLDHQENRADVYDMRAFTEGLHRISRDSIAVTLTPTGQSKEIAGERCQEHEMKVTVAMPGQSGEAMTTVLRGPVWIAPDSPGREEWARFYSAAAEKGLFFVDPRTARAHPLRTAGMTSLYQRLATMGVPYSTRLSIAVEGSSVTAGVMTRMGEASITSDTVRFSIEPVPDGPFTIPSSYTVRKK